MVTSVSTIKMVTKQRSVIQNPKDCKLSRIILNTHTYIDSEESEDAGSGIHLCVVRLICLATYTEGACFRFRPPISSVEDEHNMSKIYEKVQK
jgi:hypothetical protein